jgi:hypothetical protein
MNYYPNIISYLPMISNITISGRSIENENGFITLSAGVEGGSGNKYIYRWYLSKLINKTNAENKYNISYSFDTPLKKNITINSNATPQVPCFSIVMCVITDYNTGNYQIVKSIINWDVKYPQGSSGGMPSWEIGLFVFAGLVTAGIADAALLGIGVAESAIPTVDGMIVYDGGGLDLNTVSSLTEA